MEFFPLFLIRDRDSGLYRVWQRDLINVIKIRGSNNTTKKELRSMGGWFIAQIDSSGSRRDLWRISRDALNPPQEAA